MFNLKLESWIFGTQVWVHTHTHTHSHTHKCQQRWHSRRITILLHSTNFREKIIKRTVKKKWHIICKWEDTLNYSTFSTKNRFSLTKKCALNRKRSLLYRIFPGCVHYTKPLTVYLIKKKKQLKLFWKQQSCKDNLCLK